VEFLGIGYQEVLLVLVLMLVVVGPARMPGVAYQIGKAVREMQKYARSVRDEFSEEWSYLDTQAKEIRGEVDSASRDMRELQRSLRAETDTLDSELKSAAGDVQKALPAPATSSTNGKTSTTAASAKPTLSNANVSIGGRKPATFPTGSTTKPASGANNADRLRSVARPAAPKSEPAADSKP
jgi:sec-independent protein translocase protein TatB